MEQVGYEHEGVLTVHRALAQDADIAPYADGLQVEPGDPWVISGHVGSVVARRKAVRVARRALPGEAFDDRVRLDPKVQRSDDTLRAALLAALRSEPAFAGVPIVQTGEHPPHHDAPWIAVMVSDHTIYLGGRLDLAGKSLAEGIAWETGACCDVRNLISQEIGTADPDDELADAVRKLIAQHTALDPQSVKVEVSHGVVELRGAAVEPGQRDILVGLCWLLPGVAEVHDFLGTGAG